MRINSKDGVAVIIVLGLLALLMVLGVAFSVSMRVERTGAANYSSAAKTRQMVWAGLARAIGDINQTTPGMFPDGDFLASSTTPAWDVPGPANGVRLLTGSATNNIPDIFLPASNSVADIRSEWIPLGDTSESREGYAAYMVLNLSDMLDLNHVGGSVREGGTNVTELVMDGIGVDGVELAAARAADGPFESLAEFKALYPEVSTYALSDYSRYLPDTNRLDALYIGTTVADIEQQQGGGAASIARKLRDLRVNLGAEYRPSGPNALLMYNYLLDYVDTEMTRHAPNGPNGKAVPLLNEVSISIVSPPEFRLQGGELRVDIPNMNIETWFPFFKPAEEQFKVFWDQSTTLQVGTNALAVQTNSFASMVYPVAGQAAGMTNQFKVHESTDPPNPSRFNITVTTNDASFRLQVQISNMRVSLASDDSAVVDAATTSTLVFNSDVVSLNHPTMPRQVLPMDSPTTYQVSDPRLNWLTNSWTASDSPTMATNNPGQEGKRIHASNNGKLYSPLELGNLLMPRNATPGPVWNAWDTLLVFKEGGWRDPLLETFTTESDPLAVRRGLVNPNTLYMEKLSTAFSGMPHPCVGGPATLDAATLTAVTNMFYSAQTNGTLFDSLTDVLDDLDWQAALPGLSDVERESIAAYSTGLMGVRQNLFLIVVSASAAGQRMGKLAGAQTEVSHRGRQRAVALVWRDPVANAQGLHDCFVRQFQWLD